MPIPELYQFPVSHFCEKARWCLDYKGLDYTVRNLLPGPHLPQTRKLAGVRTVPILRDGGRCIADSTAIAQYLEQQHPGLPLLPADVPAQQALLTQVKRLDREGEDVRRWIYGHVLTHGDFRHTLYSGYDRPQRWIGYAMAPAVRLAIQRGYDIRPETLALSLHVMLKGLDTLEATLQNDPARYLAGGQFTLADLTAAALYAPLVGPADSPWPREVPGPALPPAMAAMRATVAQRPVGHWIERIYREYR
jgi:glutathione S-transferase